MSKYVYVAVDGSDIVVKVEGQVVAVCEIGKPTKLSEMLREKNVSNGDEIYLSSDIDFKPNAYATVEKAFELI